MRVPIVAECEACDREYRVTADLPQEAKAGDEWHWTRCSCGLIHLGVTKGEWGETRQWHSTGCELWVDHERDNVITFERGGGR